MSTKEIVSKIYLKKKNSFLLSRLLTALDVSLSVKVPKTSFLVVYLKFNHLPEIKYCLTYMLFDEKC